MRFEGSTGYRTAIDASMSEANENLEAYDERLPDRPPGCVERVFDVRRIAIFNHLDAGAAILGDFVDIG
jgi:hypothetical protein